MADTIRKTDAEWKAQLTPGQYRVTRKQGTEHAFTGQYWNNHADGTYRCVCCGTPLFEATTKFESGTGWPSFFAPVSKDNVRERAEQPVCPNRSGLRVVRRASGTRVSRWPRANGAALLHEFRGVVVRAEGRLSVFSKFQRTPEAF